MAGLIVVGYVPRPEGQAALTRGIEEAQLRGMNLVAVNSHKGGPEAEAAEAIVTEEQLAEIITELDAAEIEYEVRQLVRGNDAGDDLLAVAEEREADLIVLGLRQDSAAATLGNNVQQVVSRAKCPVLIVRG